MYGAQILRDLYKYNIFKATNVPLLFYCAKP